MSQRNDIAVWPDSWVCSLFRTLGRFRRREAERERKIEKEKERKSREKRVRDGREGERLIAMEAVARQRVQTANYSPESGQR